jgi:kynureninase
VARLGERTGDLGDLLVALAGAAGLEIRGPRAAASRGGIVPIAVANPKPVVDALADEGIIVDFRPGIVRCSPAFYNTEDEVRLLVERLARLVPAADRVRPD